MRFDPQKGWFSKSVQTVLGSVVGCFVKIIWNPETPSKIMKFGHNVPNSGLYNI
jgi:hypothetical protein